MSSFWKRRYSAETRLTVEGWIYLVFLAFITIGSILRNVNLLVLMAGLLYAPLILQWRVCNQLLRSLRGHRVVPQRIHAGKSVKLTWTVGNRSEQATAWNVLISDRIVRDGTTDLVDQKKSLTQRVRSSLVREDETIVQTLWRWIILLWNLVSSIGPWRGDSGVLMSIDRVEGGQTRTGAWQVVFPVRGRYDIGPARLSSTATLGLQTCLIKLSAVRQCFVAPALGMLSQGWVQQLKSMSSGDGAGTRRRGMDQEEFYALRPWRSGDSRKHIHWRTTARYGLPIVRQFDQNNDQDVAIVLDLYCPSHEETQDEESIARYRDAAETALSFVTTILSRATIDVRGRVTLGVCGQRKDFFPGRQADFLASSMKALAVAQPAMRPMTAETLLDVANVVSPSTPIFVVSTRPEPDLMLLASKGHEADARVKEVSQAIVSKRLQRIKAAVNWIQVDSEPFQKLFTMDVYDADRQRAQMAESVSSLEKQLVN